MNEPIRISWWQCHSLERWRLKVAHMNEAPISYLFLGTNSSTPIGLNLDLHMIGRFLFGWISCRSFTHKDRKIHWKLRFAGSWNPIFANRKESLAIWIMKDTHDRMTPWALSRGTKNASETYLFQYFRPFISGHIHPRKSTAGYPKIGGLCRSRR